MFLTWAFDTFKRDLSWAEISFPWSDQATGPELLAQSWTKFHFLIPHPPFFFQINGKLWWTVSFCQAAYTKKLTQKREPLFFSLCYWEICQKLLQVPPTQEESWGTSIAVLWLKLCAFTEGGMGLIPSLGTKIPHAILQGQNKLYKIFFLKRE